MLGPQERASIYDALLATTRDAAYQHFEEDRKGTLEPGKLADLVVLSRNPLRVRRSKLLELSVLATYSRGRQVYAADAE